MSGQYCYHCGRPLAPDFTFCPSCGTQVTNSALQSHIPAPDRPGPAAPGRQLMRGNPLEVPLTTRRWIIFCFVAGGAFALCFFILFTTSPPDFTALFWEGRDFRPRVRGSETLSATDMTSDRNRRAP